MERDILKEGLGARAGGEQAIFSSVLTSVSLLIGKTFEVPWIFELTTSLP